MYYNMEAIKQGDPSIQIRIDYMMKCVKAYLLEDEVRMARHHKTIFVPITRFAYIRFDVFPVENDESVGRMQMAFCRPRVIENSMVNTVVSYSEDVRVIFFERSTSKINWKGIEVFIEDALVLSPSCRHFGNVEIGMMGRVPKTPIINAINTFSHMSIPKEMFTFHEVENLFENRPRVDCIANIVDDKIVVLEVNPAMPRIRSQVEASQVLGPFVRPWNFVIPLLDNDKKGDEHA